MSKTTIIFTVLAGVFAAVRFILSRQAREVERQADMVAATCQPYVNGVPSGRLTPA